MNHEIVTQLREDGVPEADGTPLGNLRHVLALYKDSPAEREVLSGTRNVYGPGVVTGLTLGDLRALIEMVPPSGIPRT